MLLTTSHYVVSVDLVPTICARLDLFCFGADSMILFYSINTLYACKKCNKFWDFVYFSFSTSPVSLSPSLPSLLKYQFASEFVARTPGKNYASGSDILKIQ